LVKEPSQLDIDFEILHRLANNKSKEYKDAEEKYEREAFQNQLTITEIS
jgi:hypothetical protein